MQSAYLSLTRQEAAKSYIRYIRRLKCVTRRVESYKSSYRICDQIACKQYLESKSRLAGIWVNHKRQTKESLQLVLEESEKETGYIVNWDSDTPPMSPQFAGIFDMLCEATKQYLSTTRGGSGKFDKGYAKRAVAAISSIDESAELFPIRYLMVCIAGTSALFSSQKNVTVESVSKVLSDPYYKKPSELKQRISRIRFLNEVNQICGLDEVSRARNWNLFLQVHKLKIESPDEADLWREILYGSNSANEQVQEDIPSIELSLLCNEFLQHCLPIQEEYLYCYRRCSRLHLGGYATFLKEHPDILNECVERIRRRVSEDCTPLNQYLEEYSGWACDSMNVQQLCKDLADLLRWGTFKSNCDLDEFCRSLYSYQKIIDDRVDRAVIELKNLLVETSLRRILAEEATNVLKMKAEEVFNYRTAFEISLSTF